MKIAVIHASNQGFFPRYYDNIKDAIEHNNDLVRLFVPKSGQNMRCILKYQETFGTRLNWFLHYTLWKITGKQDCWSHIDTYDLIRKLKKYSPDVIHLHIINSCCINLPLLVRYFNSYDIPVVWTFHDCRVFTGNCPYFDEIGCEQWKKRCLCCPEDTPYYIPNHLNCKWNWDFRKVIICSIKNLTIVTPSVWLADFVRSSFLKEKKCEVIYNGVDTDIFRTPSKVNIRKLYNINDKDYIILGCAICWEDRKGLQYFKSLVTKLPTNYKIVLVGAINNRELDGLREKKIIAVGRTNTFEELKAWYQQASVFVNPTIADNFPTTNIEALSSGTPVVTFDTGGSAEAIDNSCGIAVKKGDIENLTHAIIEICNHPEKFTSENCINRSRCFSKKQYDKYVKLFHFLNNEQKNIHS